MKIKEKILNAILSKTLQACHEMYIQDMDINLTFEEYCELVKIKLQQNK